MGKNCNALKYYNAFLATKLFKYNYVHLNNSNYRFIKKDNIARTEFW